MKRLENARKLAFKKRQICHYLNTSPPGIGYENISQIRLLSLYSFLDVFATFLHEYSYIKIVMCARLSDTFIWRDYIYVFAFFQPFRDCQLINSLGYTWILFSRSESLSYIHLWVQGKEVLRRTLWILRWIPKICHSNVTTVLAQLCGWNFALRHWTKEFDPNEN
jgi:hypothetical protein